MPIRLSSSKSKEQPGPCVRALCDSDALFQRLRLKLHTSHFALTFRTYTSHSTLHLVSFHLSSPRLISALLISPFPSEFGSTISISSEHCSTFLISPKLFSTHLRPTAHQKAFTVGEKSLVYKCHCAQRASEHRTFRHRCIFKPQRIFTHRSFCSTASFCTQTAFTDRVLFHAACVYTQHSFTQKSFHTANFDTEVHSTLLHRNVFTRSKVLRRKAFFKEKILDAEKPLHREVSRDRCVYTRKLLHREGFAHRSSYAQNLVRTSLRKTCPSTTLYYRACKQHFPALYALYYKACERYFPV